MSAYGVFRRAGEAPRVGAREGDAVVDLSALDLDEPRELFARPSLNALMAEGPATWARVAEALAAADTEPARVPLADVGLLLPVEVADYVDFYSSAHHAANVGRMFRPDDDPLPVNWRHLPVGYHGRSSTVVVTGTPVVRPRGQYVEGEGGPSFGACRLLDLELELGWVVGVPSTLGEPVGVEHALEHLFGVVLLNDWSARDLQFWEMVPLGPFTAKSFLTSISAWVVPTADLEPHRVPLDPQEPPPLPYLHEAPWAYDLDLELELDGEVVARPSGRHLYWSPAQQLAHLTVNGASLRTGDLLGSGTVSGPGREERGCLLELTWAGSEPLTLADGSTRTFLEDGDEVVLRGGVGEVRLGEVRGRVEPARG
jgi:fumarylacetoacetase